VLAEDALHVERADAVAGHDDHVLVSGEEEVAVLITAGCVPVRCPRPLALTPGPHETMGPINREAFALAQRAPGFSRLGFRLLPVKQRNGG
jgi:hypothetical protein